MTELAPRVRTRPHSIGVLLIGVSTVIFGATPALVADWGADMPVLELLTYRAGLAALLLSALARFRAKRPGLRRVHQDSVVPGPPRRGVERVCALAGNLRGVQLGLFVLAPSYWMFFLSFQHIGTAIGVALGFVYPTLVVLMVALRERTTPSASVIGLSLLAVSGVFAIAVPASTGRISALGITLVLVSSVIYALYVVLAARLTASISSTALGAQVMAGVATGTALAALVTGQLGVLDSANEWMIVLTNGSLVFIAIAAYYAGLAVIGPTRASLIDTGQPVVALAIGVGLVGERVGPVQLAGLAAIGLSVAWSVLRGQATGSDVVVDAR